jgi:hypothetical protein
MALRSTFRPGIKRREKRKGKNKEIKSALRKRQLHKAARFLDLWQKSITQFFMLWISAN